MKKIKLLVLILITANISFNAQLLNSSFESWDVLGNPNNWLTGDIPGVIDAVSQSNDAQDGTSSAKLEVIDLIGAPHSGSIQSLDDVNTSGHPITERYTNLSGFHKFSPNGSARLYCNIIVYDATSMPIGTGSFEELNAKSSWTKFNVPIEYINGSDAANITVLITIIDSIITGIDPNIIGSTALIDNLTLEIPTNIKSDDKTSNNIFLNQNYPNPFNPSTRIKYSIPTKSKVSLKVFDVLGNEITLLVDIQQPQGNYEIEFDASTGSATGSELTSGIYFYRLQVYPATGGAETFIETKKMLMIK